MTTFQPVQFGKYILLDKIATGGMAELYRAKITGSKGFEKVIAIKKILPHLTSEEPLISSFIDEAKLAAFLQHPNIVQIYDFGDLEDSYFLAMEYLFGKDLKFIIEKSKEMNNPICLEDALLITTQICNGLFYAHNLKDFHGKSLNIIHRDIGPQNIFITFDGQVKIIDFGIAKAANQSTITQTDLIKGKVAYMSPEQAQGKTVDNRSDIFSIGIILYELTTHKRMFEGETFQIYTKVCALDFEPPESAGSDLPPILYEILNKALAENPEQRYQSAEEMGSDIEMCLSQLSDQTTTKNLAQYMKGLLEKEADAEEKAMRETASFDCATLIPPDAKSNLEDEITEALDIKELSAKPKRKTALFAALAIIFTVLSISFTWVAVENRFEGFNHGKNAVDSREINKADGVHTEMGAPTPGQEITPPDTDHPELREGERFLDEKRFTEAIAFFETILKKEPSLKEKITPPYSTALRKQAAKLFEKNESEKAKLLLLKIKGSGPEDAQGYYMLGRIYADEKDYPNAISAYEKAIELDKKMARAYFNLGYIYYVVKKDFSRAQEMYKHTVRTSPDFLDDALYMLALSQKKLGKNQQCIENLEQALIINPDNKQAKLSLARLKR